MTTGSTSSDRAPCLRGTVGRDVAHRCWDELIARFPWPRKWAFETMYCESTAWAYNRNGTHNGLMQIGNGPMDPDQNMALAYEMWKKRGAQPWEQCQ